MLRVLIVLLFCLSLSVEALYLGNPAGPGVVDKGLFSSEEALVLFQTGYQFDYVFDRKLKSAGCARARIDQFQFRMNQGVITASLADRVSVYGSVGAMQSFFSHRPSSDGMRREYQTGDNTTWGGGGRIVVYESSKLSLGFEGGYQWAQLPLRWDALDGKSFTTRSSLHYQEWQVGFGVGGQIDFLNPYGAVKYSFVKGKVTDIRSDLQLSCTSFQMRNRDHVGLVFGCTFTTGNYFDLTIESRFLDEMALSLVANMSF